MRAGHGARPQRSSNQAVIILYSIVSAAPFAMKCAMIPGQVFQVCCATKAIGIVATIQETIHALL